MVQNCMHKQVVCMYICEGFKAKNNNKGRNKAKT